MPNWLTTSRLVLAGVFVGILAVADPLAMPEGGGVRMIPLMAAVLFIVAALTDALDGHLARKWNAITPFGRVMDPFADKILVLGAFVMLAGPGFSVADGTIVSGVAPWMVVVILGRELFVTSMRGVLEGLGLDFSAATTGKLKMILQSVGVPAILVLVAFSGNSLEAELSQTLAAIIAWAIVVVTAVSGIPYAVRGFALLRTAHAGSADA